MTKEEAIKFLESLVEANMAQGVIKKFDVLDKLREALDILRPVGVPDTLNGLNTKTKHHGEVS